ncbi:hypothetical protein QJS10_CPA01g02395 [Acorus calamus]|uniref:RNase H type-1 domain-containing protein n=1 Tax=Acorus calamus TaxID=4465 RepID=A0AAV9FHY5_ACOCL|nr:hypothetical protein QJS10_CPA01g02395 [Acorus calamus]
MQDLFAGLTLINRGFSRELSSPSKIGYVNSCRPPQMSIGLHRLWAGLRSTLDGSLADDRGGYGALIRNERGEFLLGIAGRNDLPLINLLELKAIEVGLWIAIKAGFRSI